MFSHFLKVFIKVINYFISEISSIMHIFLQNLLLTQAKFVRLRQNHMDKNRVRLSECVTDIGILLQISECVGIPESPILLQCYRSCIYLKRYTRKMCTTIVLGMGLKVW